jgi:hypothetical protein
MRLISIAALSGIEPLVLVAQRFRNSIAFRQSIGKNNDVPLCRDSERNRKEAAQMVSFFCDIAFEL